MGPDPNTSDAHSLCDPLFTFHVRRCAQHCKRDAQGSRINVR
jgi:hypothetical protein